MGDRVESGERIHRPPGEDPDDGLVRGQLVPHRRVDDAGPGFGQDAERVVRPAQAEDEVPHAQRGELEPKALAGLVIREVLREDLLGVGVRTQLVVSLGEQQGDIGAAVNGQRGTAQPHDLSVVVAVAGEPCGRPEQCRIGRHARIEPGHGDQQWILPSPCAMGFDPCCVIEQELAAGQRGEPLAQDVAVERVGELDLDTAAIDPRHDEPGPVELLDDARTRGELQIGQTDGRAQTRAAPSPTGQRH